MDGEQFIVKLGGKDVDLARAMPPTIGDLKKLKRDFGFTEELLAKGDMTAAAAFLLVLLQKLDGTLTEAQLDALPLREAESAFRFIARESQVIDRPT